MWDPKLIDSIAIDIIDEEEQQEIHKVGLNTWNIIEKEFDTLKELWILQKDFDDKINEIIILLQKNKTISSNIENKLNKILIDFKKEFTRTKNAESKLSMIRYMMENISQIKTKLKNYNSRISEKEIMDILYRQESQFKQFSKSSNNIMNTNNNTSIIQIILWIFVVLLIVFLIFKFF